MDTHQAALDVDRLRADTPGCTRVVHLNNAGSALPPAVVTQTVVDHLRREEEIGGYEAHAEAVDRIEAVRTSAAALVGARADQIALLESATHAWDRAFAALVHTQPVDARHRILVSSSEYASNVLPILQLSRQCGARVEFVPDGPDGSIDLRALQATFDDDVAIVAVAQCPSQNGLVNDVAGIGAFLDDTDAWFMVDACQSAGQLPVDATAIGADFLSVTGRKFLRGPRGTGFLYASDAALTDLEPFPLDLHSATWLADGYTVDPTARRFEYWEKSYASLLGMGAAIDYALSCGIEALRDRICMLARHARAGLEGISGVRVHDRGSVQSGIVTLTKDGVESTALAAAIRTGGVNVSLSTPDYARRDFMAHGLDGLVRVSPHAYNTADEVDRLLEIVAAVS